MQSKQSKFSIKVTLDNYLINHIKKVNNNRIKEK